jgi:acetylornithine deacetylase/succinyl-diaminopimelate desuccinylase-like protein
MSAIEAVDARSDRALEKLKAFLAIPSISTDPAYRGAIEQCADFVLAEMLEAGLEARQIRGDGCPLVYGEWCQAPGRPTLLFYGHYDVQPPDPLDEWRNDPFEATIEDGRIVARGATDDKGQCFAHLQGVAALLGTTGSLPVNVKFLIEGEEESGGEAIDAFVRADRGDLLSCDGVVVSDGPMFGPGRPSIVYGLRGIAYCEIRVSGPAKDLHSGHWGGAVANPLNQLTQVLAALQDPVSGRVRIPGFYDAARPLEAWEKEGIEGLAFDERAAARELGLEAFWGDPERPVLERRWSQPSLDVHGIVGGYQGEGGKTVIPRRAVAKLSMRLVPDQTPDAALESLTAFVAGIAPPGVDIEVVPMNGCKPMLTDPAGPITESVAAALGEVWGREPVLQRHGGSIPIVSTFLEALEVPVVLAGYGLPDDGPHSPNEKLELRNFVNGMKTTVRLLERLGARP